MICPHCMSDGLDDEATRCPHCGGRIGPNPMRKWVVSIVLLVAIVAVLVMFTTSQNKASRQACDQVEVVC